jgi:hypothetical protein
VQAAIVFLNVVMATTVHMISPDAQQLRRRRRIYYDIEERKLDALAKNAEKFAPETAQVHADKWLEDERAQIRPLQLRGRSMPVYNRPTKGQIITLKSIKKPDYAADGGNPVIDTEKEDEQPEMQGPFSLNSQVQPFQGRIKRQK